MYMSFSRSLLIHQLISSLIRADPPSWKSPLSYLSYLLTPYSAEEKAGFERTMWYRNKASGYFIEQSTFPQTLAYGLTDSPVALLGWIYEKLVTWTDDYKWTDDEGSSSATS
jgi:hypothetical protein